MNTELMHRVADHIDAMPDGFDMSMWAQPSMRGSLCDTVGCVAGWAVMLSSPKIRARVIKQDPKLEHYEWETKARDLLGLNAWDATNIFTSGRWWAYHMEKLGFVPDSEDDAWDGEYVSLDDVPPKAAAEILRGIADGVIELDDELWGDE